MTVAATTPYISYTGNNSTTAYAVPFKFLADADLTITLTDKESNRTTPVLNLDYTVAGAGADAGGTVTFTTAPASDWTIEIHRWTDRTQDNDVTENNDLLAEVIEDGDDRNTLIEQENSYLANGQLTFNRSAYDASVFSGSDVPTPVTSDVGKLLQVDAAGSAAWADLPSFNALINGDMRVSRQGNTFDASTTPANNDDTYTVERWILLSDGNDIVDVTRIVDDVTENPPGSHASMRLTVQTANKKFGIVQILEKVDAESLLNKTVSLSFKGKTKANSIEHVRASVLAWTGTVNAVTSDVVSGVQWGAAGVDPTLATSWTYEIAGSDIDLENDWTTYKVEGIVLDTSLTNNLAVFIWIDDDDAGAGADMFITDVQLEVGAVATEYRREAFSTLIQKCSRYLQAWGQGTSGIAFDANEFDFFVQCQPEMFAAPTPTLSTATMVVNTIDDGDLSSAGSSTVTGSDLGARGGRIRIDDFTITAASEDHAMIKTGNIILRAEL